MFLVFLSQLIIVALVTGSFGAGLQYAGAGTKNTPPKRLLTKLGLWFIFLLLVAVTVLAGATSEIRGMVFLQAIVCMIAHQVGGILFRKMFGVYTGPPAPAGPSAETAAFSERLGGYAPKMASDKFDFAGRDKQQPNPPAN